IDILPVSGSTSSGQTKSFQTVITDKIETTPMIGRDTGSTIEQRIRSGDAPSISAASSSSRGIESKKRFNRNTKNPLAAAGNQIAQGVFSRSACSTGRSFATRYVGSSNTIGGIINVASIAPSTSFPSTGRSFESAYAAVTSTASVNSHAPPAYS